MTFEIKKMAENTTIKTPFQRRRDAKAEICWLEGCSVSVLYNARDADEGRLRDDPRFCVHVALKLDQLASLLTSTFSFIAFSH
jgi:hypothetical protein